ncbi:MAG: 23S rRNA (guanosine(2251)-2'-O)-methyltransferase RlmB [Gaiellales bacterium]
MAERRPPRGGGRRRPPRPTGAPQSAGSDTPRPSQDRDALDPERMVFGRHPVREASRGRRRIRALYATRAALDDLADIVPDLREQGIPIEVLGDHALVGRLAGSQEHQGVVAEVDPFPYVSLDDMLARARKAGVAPLVLCLDQVTDPHNLGAIARVADAAGASGLLIPEHRSAHVTGAAVKASAGALEHVLVARCTNLANEIERVKGANLWAYAATERGTSDWTDVDLADGALLVLGAEGPGIRPRVLSVCDAQVRIPMSGSVASLNVATVSAVLAFEAVRQRRAVDSH